MAPELLSLWASGGVLEAHTGGTSYLVGMLNRVPTDDKRKYVIVAFVDCCYRDGLKCC